MQSTVLQLIDTHAHLDDERFQGDFEEMLQRARETGLECIITIATTLASSRANLQLARQHDCLFASVGIHPNNAAEAAAGDWDQVLGLIGQAKVVALGETGLDRHWDYTPFPLQEDYFARHLEESRRHHLPLVIHCREAEADMLRMLRADFDRHGPIHGVMHSFAADLPTAQSCLDMGLYISFAGMVTYKNAQALRDVVPHIPRDRILVETDSPYLAPVPCRGKRNEPAFVRHTAEQVASLMDTPVVDFARQTTANAHRLFGIT